MLAFSEPIAFGFCCAILGVVFSEVRPGWFGLWYRLLLWLEVKGKAGAWVSKPLGQCAQCTSGFLAFIAYMVAWCWHWWAIPAALLASASAILFVPGINKYRSWTQQ